MVLYNSLKVKDYLPRVMIEDVQAHKYHPQDMATDDAHRRDAVGCADLEQCLLIGRRV